MTDDRAQYVMLDGRRLRRVVIGVEDQPKQKLIEHAAEQAERERDMIERGPEQERA